ncbi:hypothetical protein ACHWQZ_G011271 [Mnemiopsis leidyi]
MLTILVVLTLFSSAYGCSGDSFTVTSYTTTNLPLATETAILVEFTADCPDSKLSAVIGGEILPVYSTSDGNMVTLVKEHSALPASAYNVDFYDEAGIAAYKNHAKDSAVEAPTPIHTASVNHPGVSKEGLPIQTEFIVMVASLLVWWGANSIKAKISE